MRIFYDCKFLEDGHTIDLISIGMVAHTDVGERETLYAVNDKLIHKGSDPHSLYRRITRHRWLMTNVVPNLPLAARRPLNQPDSTQAARGGDFWLDEESPHVLPLRLIRAQVREFVLGWDEPELWAWYGAYDHVVLCQLFGAMIDLPEGFPMWTNDIRTLALLAGKSGRDGAPEQASPAHHALNDARHDRALYEWYAPLVDPRRLA